MKLTRDLDRQQECTNRVIDWLHQAWELTGKGRSLQPDPFYPRREVLTPEVVYNVIANIEGIFVSELTKYPDYHRRAQGISTSEYLVQPGFDKLTATEQLAVVQGIDRIMQEYRDD